jgi:uridylate kinase
VAKSSVTKVPTFSPETIRFRFPFLKRSKNDVDGVYDKDPKLDSSAVSYESISYLDAIEKRLKVMDSTALSLCMEYSIPIVVFDLFKKGNLNRIVSGEKVGTLVTEDLATEE